MIKLLASVALLIAAAMIAGAYLQFNPAILIFAILGFGCYMVTRIGGPLPPDGTTHWGTGHGIYFDRDDVWVTGRDAQDDRDFRHVDGTHPP